jgi:hypothetical protein
MSYVIYGNTGNQNSYSANSVPINSGQVDEGVGASWSTGGKADLSLRVGGTDFNDFTDATNRNTYTFVNGTTAVSNGDDVEIKYDKDDDGNNQDIDVVSIDLSGFDADFNLNIKSGQTADRLYLSNVLSFQVAGQSVVNGGATTADSNGNIFGEQTFRIEDDKNSSATITYQDANGDVKTINLTLSGGGATNMQVMVDFLCFTRGTLIETDRGQTTVEDLLPGDMVKTKDNGYQAIEWISSRKLSGDDLKRNPHLWPIRFKKGALGDNLPTSDLIVSPQHRMVMSGSRCEMIFGETEVLAPAKGLTNDNNIMTDYEVGEVEYFHFMCSRHEIVFANGAESESFHPGDFGISSLDELARQELYEIFPDLRGGAETFGPTARPPLKVFEARLLVD